MVVIITNFKKHSREGDLRDLRRQAKSSDPFLAKQARETGARIAKESRLVEDMRQHLIKAHREGNMQEIKDIHDFVINKARYRNE